MDKDIPDISLVLKEIEKTLEPCSAHPEVPASYSVHHGTQCRVYICNTCKERIEKYKFISSILTLLGGTSRCVCETCQSECDVEDIMFTLI